LFSTVSTPSSNFGKKVFVFFSASSIDTILLCSLMLPALLISARDRSFAISATEPASPVVANYNSKLSPLLWVAASAANLQQNFSLKLIRLSTPSKLRPRAPDGAASCIGTSRFDGRSNWNSR
jgi:hypothetical protein